MRPVLLAIALAMSMAHCAPASAGHGCAVVAPDADHNTTTVLVGADYSQHRWSIGGDHMHDSITIGFSAEEDSTVYNHRRCIR